MHCCFTAHPAEGLRCQTPSPGKEGGDCKDQSAVVHRSRDQGQRESYGTSPEHVQCFLACQWGHAKEAERQLLWGRVKGFSSAPSLGEIHHSIQLALAMAARAPFHKGAVGETEVVGRKRMCCDPRWRGADPSVIY